MQQYLTKTHYRKISYALETARKKFKRHSIDRSILESLEIPSTSVGDRKQRTRGGLCLSWSLDKHRFVWGTIYSEARNLIKLGEVVENRCSTMHMLLCHCRRSCGRKSRREEEFQRLRAEGSTAWELAEEARTRRTVAQNQFTSRIYISVFTGTYCAFAVSCQQNFLNRSR